MTPWAVGPFDLPAPSSLDRLLRAAREAEVYVTESGDDGKVANSERISPSAPQHRLAPEGSSWNPHILDVPSLPRGGPHQGCGSTEVFLTIF